MMTLRRSRARPVLGRRPSSFALGPLRISWAANVFGAASAVLLSASTPVFAVDPGGSRPAYLDDRSTGASLVRSLYNAIERREYLRAWSYFDEAADRPDFETFARGYEDTEHVRLKLGKVTGDGAAGSLYTNVPAAIEATDKGGKRTVFSGCYVTRLVQPAVQETPPFRALHIEKASLSPALAPFDEVKPSCPGR